MWEVGVNWAANDLTSNFPEMLSFLWEIDDFGWAYEGEIEGIEEE